MESISGAFPFCNPLTSPSSGGGGGGGGRRRRGRGVSKNFLRPLRPQFGLKIRGGGRRAPLTFFLKELESSRNGNGHS